MAALCFNTLPIEVFIKILEYLPSEDIPSLIYVNSRFFEVLTRVPVSGTLNLEKAHLLALADIKQFFHKNMMAPKIRTLILNGLWWFDPVKHILNCQNVQVLHMMDIRLTANQLRKILFSCTKIKDLSFSMPTNLTLHKNIITYYKCDVLKNLEKLKFLIKEPSNLMFLEYTEKLRRLEIIFDVDSSHRSTELHQLMKYSKHVIYDTNKYEHLRELKIITSPLLYISGIAKWLQIFVTPLKCSSIASYEIMSSFADFRPMSNVVEDISWFSRCQVLKFPVHHTQEDQLQIMKFPHMKELFIFGQYQGPVTDVTANMPNLRSFHLFAKCSIPLDLGLLSSQHPDLEKLSFRCFTDTHSCSYVHEEMEHFSNLTHLCIPPCVLESKLPNLVPKKSITQMFKFKRPRIGEPKIQEKADEAAFNKVLKNCPRLKVLEIALFKEDFSIEWHDTFCRRPPSHWHCVENLKYLTDLTHLTLEFLPVTSGDFLKRIAEGCTKLEFLRLKDLGLQGKFVYCKDISEALPKFKNLISFRLENNYLLPGKLLFESLKECSKLERVSLFSMREDRFERLSQQALISLLLTKENLLFAHFTFTGMSGKIISDVLKVIKPKKPKYLHFSISNKDHIELDRTIPLKHSKEMMQFLPWIAV